MTQISNLLLCTAGDMPVNPDRSIQDIVFDKVIPVYLCNNTGDREFVGTAAPYIQGFRLMCDMLFKHGVPDMVYQTYPVAIFKQEGTSKYTMLTSVELRHVDLTKESSLNYIDRAMVCQKGNNGL